MTVVDSAKIIRQNAVVSNYNDGRYHSTLIPVMISAGTALGPATFQVVTVYSCLGFTRTVYGPVIEVPIVAVAP
jgi:hypothetical protein